MAEKYMWTKYAFGVTIPAAELLYKIISLYTVPEH